MAFGLQRARDRRQAMSRQGTKKSAAKQFAGYAGAAGVWRYADLSVPTYIRLLMSALQTPATPRAEAQIFLC